MCRLKGTQELPAWFAAAAALYSVSAARTLQLADGSKLTFYALAGYLPSLDPGDHPGWALLVPPGSIWSPYPRLARRPLVLADRWEPYYRTGELVRRPHLVLSP